MRTPKADKPYFTLCIREGATWSPEFGDFDRETVEGERADWLDHYTDAGKRRRKADTMIITTRYGSGQADIDRWVADLNSRAA